MHNTGKYYEKYTPNIAIAGKFGSGKKLVNEHGRILPN